MLPGNTGWYSDAETNKELFFFSKFLLSSPSLKLPNLFYGSLGILCVHKA